MGTAVLMGARWAWIDSAREFPKSVLDGNSCAFGERKGRFAWSLNYLL
jgi:hypothetical protein